MSDASRPGFSLDRIATARWPFFALFILVFFLTHLRQNAINNYDCELCADKAGYYVYLPAMFEYGFLAKDFPENSDADHGYGFHLDSAQNKVITKFTCGVAVMQLPFYLIAKTAGTLTGNEQDPFSRFYLLFINIGAAFYCTTGLYFLKRWFESQSNARSAFVTMLITLFGTHLYYYTLDESLMSHVYSFALLSATLFAVMRFEQTRNLKYIILLAASLALAILIRPTNVLFALIALFAGTSESNNISSRLKLFFVPKYLLLMVLIFLVAFLPQFIYWKFAYGSYVAWSYTGEGFTNWNHPHFAEVLFSPQSGLFPYAPLVLLSLVVAFFYWRKNKNAAIVIGIFLAVTYLCASWSNYNFGECNFGKRPFVEYLPVLMLPVLWMVHSVQNRTTAVKWCMRIMLVAVILYNIWLFGAFDTCFGGTQWDWNKFGELLSQGSLLP
jgi:hypothetical protein